MPPTPTDPRLDALRAWLDALPADLGLDASSLRPASDDASFRRYFRVDAAGAAGGSLIVMDAPPDRENCAPFVQAARVFRDAGLSVPQVFDTDLEAGVLLLEDLGNDTYLSTLDGDSADGHYRDAGGALIRLQQASRPGVFPDYDRALLERELLLYPDWYVARHKRVELTDSMKAAIAQSFDLLIKAALSQPRVYVHRDWHSRNLMQLEPQRNPGVLDFQDAVYGPITYDLVSLLRDAYITWPEERQRDWAIRYWEGARKASLPVADDFGEFYRDFEWMGLQRQLKVLGIFARLYHRDGKDGYLNDIPLVMEYTRKCAYRYKEFAPLIRLLDTLEEPKTSVGFTF